MTMIVKGIVLDHTSRSKKPKARTLSAPKVIVAGEIIRMTKARIASLFGVHGYHSIEGLRMQWLTWLDDSQEGYANAQEAAWAFKSAMEQDHEPTLSMGRSIAKKVW